MKPTDTSMMDIQNFITEFKKTFVYALLSQTLTDEQLFEHAIDGDGVTWFKEQMRQMWDLWQAAKAQAVPEGFVLVEDKPVAYMVQNKFWKGEFQLMLLSEIPEPEFEGDSYDIEIPLYTIKAQEPTNNL